MMGVITNIDFHHQYFSLLNKPLLLFYFQYREVSIFKKSLDLLLSGLAMVMLLRERMRRKSLFQSDEHAPHTFQFLVVFHQILSDRYR